MWHRWPTAVWCWRQYLSYCFTDGRGREIRIPHKEARKQHLVAIATKTVTNTAMTASLDGAVPTPRWWRILKCNRDVLPRAPPREIGRTPMESALVRPTSCQSIDDVCTYTVCLPVNVNIFSTYVARVPRPRNLAPVVTREPFVHLLVQALPGVSPRLYTTVIDDGHDLWIMS